VEVERRRKALPPSVPPAEGEVHHRRRAGKLECSPQRGELESSPQRGELEPATASRTWGRTVLPPAGGACPRQGARGGRVATTATTHRYPTKGRQSVNQSATIVQRLCNYCNVPRDESLEGTANLPDPHVLANGDRGGFGDGRRFWLSLDPWVGLSTAKPNIPGARGSACNTCLSEPWCKSSIFPPMTGFNLRHKSWTRLIKAHHLSNLPESRVFYRPSNTSVHSQAVTA